MRHKAKHQDRPHFIPEWAEKRGLIQSELADAIGADRSVVSRWYGRACPSLDWQERLADLFHCERDSLFRHPDEDWLARFLRGRNEEEIQRIKATLEMAFPRKVA